MSPIEIGLLLLAMFLSYVFSGWARHPDEYAKPDYDSYGDLIDDGELPAWKRVIGYLFLFAYLVLFVVFIWKVIVGGWSFWTNDLW